MPMTRTTHTFWRNCNGYIGVDEFVVVVAQERAYVRKPLLEVKEHRAATHKRLHITLNPRGEKFVELCQELRFATDPFQKRLSFFRRNRLNSSDRKLLVTDFPAAWSFRKVRVDDF